MIVARDLEHLGAEVQPHDVAGGSGDPGQLGCQLARATRHVEGRSTRTDSGLASCPAPTPGGAGKASGGLGSGPLGSAGKPPGRGVAGRPSGALGATGAPVRSPCGRDAPPPAPRPQAAPAASGLAPWPSRPTSTPAL